MSFPRAVVLGATGQLGSALLSLLPKSGFEPIGLNRHEANLSKPESLVFVLEKARPQWVINAAAFTDVAGAEKQESLATIINGKAPEVMARWCAQRRIPFIMYSTDYVFSGSSQNPYGETDMTGPLNAYGRSKLAGDLALARIEGQWMNFRTSWIYAEEGKNFLLTMLKLGTEKELLKVVSDQIGAPTYARDLAWGTIKAITFADKAKVFPTGIYNMCNSGETSWFGFAQEIFALANVKGGPLKIKEVAPVLTKDYANPVTRPLNSRLSLIKLSNTFDIKMRHWREALSDCMERVP